jgi:hypothetical protein
VLWIPQVSAEISSETPGETAAALQLAAVSGALDELFGAVGIHVVRESMKIEMQVYPGSWAGASWYPSSLISLCMRYPTAITFSTSLKLVRRDNLFTLENDVRSVLVISSFKRPVVLSERKAIIYHAKQK